MEEKKEEQKKEGNELKKSVGFPKVTVGLILYILCAVVVGMLFGFYVGTKYGINIGGKATLQYLEYTAAEPVNVDVSLIDSDPTASYGPEDAKIKIKYFADLQCPSCATMVEESVSKLIDENKYRIEFYDFPLPEHKYAGIAAKYARCAVDNGVDYLKFIRQLNSDYSNWASMLKEANVSEYMLQTAVAMGAEEDAMNLCVIDEKISAAIQENMDDGIKIGIKGTPSYTIGDGLVQGYVSPATLSHLLNNAKTADTEQQ